MAAPAWYKVSATACVSELLAMVWFSFFGGIVQGAAAPIVNGLTLVACIYSVVAISGAHINPGQKTRTTGSSISVRSSYTASLMFHGSGGIIIYRVPQVSRGQ